MSVTVRATNRDKGKEKEAEREREMMRKRHRNEILEIHTLPYIAGSNVGRAQDVILQIHKLSEIMCRNEGQTSRSWKSTPSLNSLADMKGWPQDLIFGSPPPPLNSLADMKGGPQDLILEVHPSPEFVDRHEGQASRPDPGKPPSPLPKSP